jgi:hypothetical protein
LAGNLQLLGGDFSDFFNDVSLLTKYVSIKYLQSLTIFNATLAMALEAEVDIPYIVQVDNPDLPFGGILGLGWDFDQNKKTAGQDGASFVANWLGKSKNRVYALKYDR